ncbi:MAG: hypothetical protein E2P02_25785 [Acidobacteria bacterium]|nr:MAG: hypothetical protein E2P02_25785 [Acidobacteriota bacterium]
MFEESGDQHPASVCRRPFCRRSAGNQHRALLPRPYRRSLAARSAGAARAGPRRADLARMASELRESSRVPIPDAFIRAQWVRGRLLALQCQCRVRARDVSVPQRAGTGSGSFDGRSTSACSRDHDASRVLGIGINLPISERSYTIMRRKASLCSALTILITLTAAAGVTQVGKNDGVVNPNLAGKDELLRLAHLDENLVASILEQRPSIGMLALHELLQPMLSEEALEELYAQLFVPIDLNTASREEILLVPGVGRRMAHEFEEYRPYKAMAQFRREIGKYVDDDEVARLEQYVFVPIDLNTASEDDILSIPGVGQRMLHEFMEYRPYRSMAQFRREIGKYVDDDELNRLARYVTLRPE